MRTGAPTEHRGYRHEAVLYDSDQELLDVVVPFLREGVAAAEPCLVALTASTTRLVRAAVGDTTGLTFLHDRYDRPASVIRSNRHLFTAYLIDGASRIRVASEVPHPGVGVPWDGWARYEAAINHAYAEFPLWGLCAYDTRIAPGRVLDEVARTHPYLATAEGHRVNPRYQDPAEFLTQCPPSQADPVEAVSPPLIDLTDPTPAAARDAVHTARTIRTDTGRRDSTAPGTAQVEAPQPASPRRETPLLDPIDVEHLVFAVSEAVTNALIHGRPPVRFRLWTAPDRIVATVTDRGDGPADPFAGLLPVTDPSSGGLGLWLTHQLCSHVTHDTTDDGFTIRLVVGTPQPGRRGHAPENG
jgi:MEDS: MEthanogen/methylotroph, DcmR Sensory domain/Histidine kinase-like ATPase domain